ncbi:hypothetical protein [Mycolicibacterium gadium]|uniref:hypothetical protein n=1 Tax=Mycolicibacterium gadium TaxID=1794 RepID=UPI0013D11FC8|nr:hypothetical protein [Mycolicibacterium gadium]
MRSFGDDESFVEHPPATDPATTKEALLGSPLHSARSDTEQGCRLAGADGFRDVSITRTVCRIGLRTGVALARRRHVGVSYRST